MDRRYEIISWRAWYAGGVEYNSLATPWPDLPSHGALVFVCYHRRKDHKRLMAGVSLYWCDVTPRGVIYACDNAADALIPSDLDPCMVKYGQWVPDEEYYAAYHAAVRADLSPDESRRE